MFNSRSFPRWSIFFILVAVTVISRCSPVDANDASCESSELGYACKVVLSPFFTLHWTLGGSPVQTALLDGEVAFPGDGEAAFALEGDSNGWVGLGFTARSGFMFPADVVLGFKTDDGETSVRAFKLDNYGIRERNADESVILKDVFVSEKEGKTIVAYTRSIREGGSVPVSLETETPVTFAVGPADGLVYHRRSRGAASIVLGAALNANDSVDAELSVPSSEG